MFTGWSRSRPSKTIKILALRGFVRLVPQQDVPDAHKFAALKEAMDLAERSEEKQLVLERWAMCPRPRPWPWSPPTWKTRR